MNSQFRLKKWITLRMTDFNFSKFEKKNTLVRAMKKLSVTRSRLKLQVVRCATDTLSSQHFSKKMKTESVELATSNLLIVSVEQTLSKSRNECQFQPLVILNTIMLYNNL